MNHHQELNPSHSVNLSDSPWWKEATIYQIYPRSFLHGGSGSDPRVGDLAGIEQRIDYIASLGVDAIWLSPIFKSPMADYGYDIADYLQVDALFGTNEDLQRLIERAHLAGLKLLLDLVPCHTSNQHPWFVEASSSPDSTKRDWYVWADPKDSQPPTQWKAAFGGSAWTFDEQSSQFYLHSFLAEQPDLNWANPLVERAMCEVVKHYYDRGVDGFRIDVVHNLVKDPQLVDSDLDRAGLPHFLQTNLPQTHEILRRLRSLSDAYPGERLLIGEVATVDPDGYAQFYGDNDELNLNFNFIPMHARLSANNWRQAIADSESLLGPLQAWPCWVLSNHDLPRHRSRYGGTEAVSRACAVMLLTLRGTPVLYAGEELGLWDAAIPPERVVDPGGRDGCRGLIPWGSEFGHGWPVRDGWLPFAGGAEHGNDANSQLASQSSVYWLYRRLLGLRREHRALTQGSIRLLEGSKDVLAYSRAFADNEITVAINLTDEITELEAAGRMILRSSDPSAPPAPFTGELGPFEGVIIES